MKKFKFNKKTDNLFEAILSLKNKKEAEKYFRDLCTLEEIQDMADRWGMVSLIDKGVSYRMIADKFKASTTTVSRVAFWLKNGMGGYKLILDRLNSAYHHNSSSVGRELC